MSNRDLFHENHVAMSMEFKMWTDIHGVRLELDLDLDLGDQEEIECEEQDHEDTLATAEKVPKKIAFLLLMRKELS